MPFLSNFNDDAVDGGIGGVLEEDLLYRSVRYKETYTVPAGTESDYGSVPWWMPKWIVPRGAQFRREYFLHDAFYRNKIRYGKGQDEVTRGMADLILKDSMAETAAARKHLTSHLWKVRSWAAWAGVRIAGWPAWVERGNG